MATIQPIKPDEVIIQKKESIPDEVMTACNKLIGYKWNGTEAKFTQDEFIEEIENLVPEHITREHMFKHRWLDIEDIYIDAGWIVIYDKPGYNENPYPATFTFRKK